MEQGGYPAQRSGFEFNQPTIVALLYLASMLTGVTALIGLILAYVWKNEATEGWMRSHYSFHIRTFWYSLALGLVGTLTILIGVGILILALLGLYMLIRTILALLEAQKHNPIPRPEALFW
jgi:uncharacterized membrane protein